MGGALVRRRRRPIASWIAVWLTIIGVCGFVFSVNAADVTDPEGACREDLLMQGEERQKALDPQIEYRWSVFRVLVEGANPAFQGNAVLVSERGFFLTAAHVVVDAVSSNKKIWVQRSSPGEGIPDRFEVEARHIGRPSWTPRDAAVDLALLRAVKWPTDDSFSRAVPLRYTGSVFSLKDVILAFSDATHSLQRETVERVALDPNDEDGALVGAVFYGWSGAPLIDDYGMVEGIVADYNNRAEEGISEIGGDERVFVYMKKRERFGAAQIVPGDVWLKDVPVDDRRIEDVARNCEAGKVDNNDTAYLRAHPRMPLQSVDHLYLACRHTQMPFAFKWSLAKMMESVCAPMSAIEKVVSSGH